MKLCVLIVSGMCVVAANANMFAVSTGTGAPPATLGSYNITALPVNGNPDGTTVTSAPGVPPLTGDVQFDRNMQKATAGATWATWSHGYTGDVYYTTDSSERLLITLPANTGAFLFYTEPTRFAALDITALSDSGATLTQSIDGSGGATGFGFYGDAGESISTILVSSAEQFGVGEFYAAQTPEPASLGLLALGGLLLARRR